MVGAACAAVIALCLWAYLTAHRLDRLHIRLDRSREALQAALDRRCAVIAATLPSLASRARATEEIRLTARDIATRLEAEDALRGAVDGGVDKDARADAAREALAEADVRVMLALRFYNDAVRETRAIRLLAPVRALRLGGTAALPDYAHVSSLHLPT
ncbi:hypothetical protein C3E79_06230 [Corynebacterium liangguodongii]|uniref:Uncharacterized protein n=1 Tax=Corynebacterium liangguodongii TaxID=2079535 RepID=A0A2S0WH82_9CORY|nr:hypothetical protein C3E79_06230 [Corynebacterium liangguodongii]PWC00321.1 hypothetical protein DF219_02870 [Corynebacterium liangguodongii]